MNGYQGQILASDQINKCFKQNEEIFVKIKQQSSIQCSYIQAIGIQARPDTGFFLNHQFFKIGQNGFLQLNNTKITSIKFLYDTDSTVKIDYIIHE